MRHLPRRKAGAVRVPAPRRGHRRLHLSCHTAARLVEPDALTRASVNQLCLECHSPISGGTLGSQPPSFHDLLSPRYRNCTTCHVAIHGSNSSPRAAEVGGRDAIENALRRPPRRPDRGRHRGSARVCPGHRRRRRARLPVGRRQRQRGHVPHPGQRGRRLRPPQPLRHQPRRRPLPTAPGGRQLGSAARRRAGSACAPATSPTASTSATSASRPTAPCPPTPTRLLDDGILPGQHTWDRTREMLDLELQLLPGQHLLPIRRLPLELLRRQPVDHPPRRAGRVPARLGPRGNRAGALRGAELQGRLFLRRRDPGLAGLRGDRSAVPALRRRRRQQLRPRARAGRRARRLPAGGLVRGGHAGHHRPAQRSPRGPGGAQGHLRLRRRRGRQPRTRSCSPAAWSPSPCGATSRDWTSRWSPTPRARRGAATSP